MHGWVTASCTRENVSSVRVRLNSQRDFFDLIHHVVSMASNEHYTAGSQLGVFLLFVAEIEVLVPDFLLLLF